MHSFTGSTVRCRLNPAARIREPACEDQTAALVALSIVIALSYCVTTKTCCAILGHTGKRKNFSKNYNLMSR
jgi:hypothetical protein